MAIALVQHIIGAEGTAPSSTTVVLSFGAAVTSGNAVVGTLTYSQGTGGADNFVSLLDDKGNSYTLAAHFFDTANTQYCTLFHLENITNGPITLTATFSPGVGFRALAMAEFSGVATSSAADGAASQLFTGSTTTDAVTSGNITTTANGDLIYSAFYDEAVAGATFTQGTGFTALDIASSAGTFPFGHEYQIQSTAGTIAGTWTQSISGGADVLVLALKAALPSIGWYRREFESVPLKFPPIDSAPALGIRKLTSAATPSPIIWREHDNVPFAKGRDDPGARGTSLTIPLAAPIIPRTSHDLNPFAQGRDEPARWRIQPLPTPRPVYNAPHDFNPFAQGRSERPALGTALTIPTVPPVYNAPHNFNPFALGRSEPPAMGLPKLLITTLAPLVFWREHDNTPYAQGRSEPSSRVYQLIIPTAPPVYNAPHDFNPFAQGRSEPSQRVFALTIPTVPPVYNAPHDFNPFALGRSEPPALGWKSLPTPPPVLLAPHDFNPFAQGRSEPAPWRIPVLVTPMQVYNAPHDFNPFALGKSEPPAIGWPKLLIAVLAPIVFNAPAIHTAFVQGSSEPAANGWMILQQPVVVVTEFHALPFFDTVGSLKTM